MGQDCLHGGPDGLKDVFVLASHAHSPVGAGRDQILDFTCGQDLLDLREIDANRSTGADDAFGWGGTTPRANALWWAARNGNILLQGDVTGDGRADLEILLRNQSGLGSADILL